MTTQKVKQIRTKKQVKNFASPILVDVKATK